MSHAAFHADRWAGAFLAVSGEDADGAFLCLRALAAPVKSVSGVFFGHGASTGHGASAGHGASTGHGASAGHGASTGLEKILRESADAAGEKEVPLPLEYAIRFICLLVEKNCFRHIDLLLRRIEQKLDEQKGLLALSLETAAPIDSGFEKELSQLIKEKTGASGVKMNTSVKPELLGGFLLRIGGFYIDASLKGQLEAMKVELLKGSK